ncbi:MAG: putative sensor domain DACNV-containing protein [Acidobacteriota bacterium]
MTLADAGATDRDKLDPVSEYSYPSYPAARVIALRAKAHFDRHVALARQEFREHLAPEPDPQAIEAIVDAAFWASLRREEGTSPKISLAFVSPESAGEPLIFERPLPLSPAALAKLAPAVERPGIHLGVWRLGENQLGVWGTTRSLPPMSFVLEVVTSGLLVIKHRSESFGKFVNVAVLEGDEVKIIDEKAARVPDCPGVVASLLGVEVVGIPADSGNVLVQIAASMRAHGRGGALLVVPSGSDTWRESILSPVLYSVSPPFSGLSTLVADRARSRESHEWQEDLRRAVAAMAGLTAVDGATVINERYELLAFGAKITRSRGNPPVERIAITEPVEGSTIAVVSPYQLGGTRHFSAAQFVHDQKDATALVASQDGRYTIFKWSPCEDIVHAHRVEALLL